MQHELSPSAIACRGLGLAPATGTPWRGAEPTQCAACGTAILPGQPAVPWKQGKGTFTDWTRLARQIGGLVHRQHVCAHCAPLLGNQGLEATKASVISREGAWSLLTDAQRIWFLRSPPKPPFVATIALAQKQHVIWDARVTLDTRCIAVQCGARSLSIDHDLLLQAEAWCIEAADLARGAGCKLAARHPFASLDRALKNPSHGVMRPEVVRVSKGIPRLATLLTLLAERIGPGELWALAHLVKAAQPDPDRSPIVLTPTKEKAP